MIQRLLTPLRCEGCGNDYYETGYWRDGELCLSCSTNTLRREKERKRELARQAAEAARRYGLDLDKWPDDMPEDVRKELNPRNAGRKDVKYESAYCELLVERAAEGKTEAQFAAEVQISQGLVQYWTEKHPRFKVAREVANELREAWFESNYHLAMLSKIPCNPSMMIRYAAAKYGWGDKSESVLTGGGGEIPVVKIVERDAGFPQETLAPTPEQAAVTEMAATTD